MSSKEDSEIPGKYNVINVNSEKTDANSNLESSESPIFLGY